MGNILFEFFRREAEFLNPMKNFKKDTHLLEHRKDPLTGTMSIIGESLRDKVQVLFGKPNHDLIQRVAEKTREGCFMCPDKVFTVTPEYSSDILPEGRLNIGEATLFPNLFPLSEFHAVCALTQTHYLNLRDFTPELLADGIQVCIEFIKSVCLSNNSVKYMTINCNYLFPAGASIVHPHIQVLGGDVPYTFMNRILEGSYQYYTNHQSNFWRDLVEYEKATGERYIGKTGNVEWLSSFSPIGSNEVQGITVDKQNFLQLTRSDALSIGEGLSKILSFYEKEGFSTFNFTIYSGPLNEETGWFWNNIRIISRSNVYENYRTDDYFLQKLLGNEILVTSPEVLAEKLRSMFL